MANTTDITFKVLNAIHRGIFSATKGRVAGNLRGMPVVLLTTTGRKTGQKRQSMLTSPLQEGDTIVLIASKGGDPRHPAWFLNLQANPEVEVVMGGSRRTMRATVADPEEKARIWPLVVAKYKNYAGYQQKTDRDIPVVLLNPA